MKRLDWFIARRYSSSRNGRFGSFSTVISIGGFAVGVMALLIVVAVMTGLRSDLQQKILSNTPHIYIFEPNGEFRIGDWENVIARLRKSPAVRAAEPFILANVAILNRDRPAYAQPAQLTGLDPRSSKVPIAQVEMDIRDGKYPWGSTASGLPGVLVGYRLATRMSLYTGDTVVVMSAENLTYSAFGQPQPNTAYFEVTGLFDTKMFQFDDQNMIADLHDVQAYLGLPPDTVGLIAVNVGDPWAAKAVADTLLDTLGDDFRYMYTTWIDTNGPLFDALSLEKLAMGLILSLIILVASFNIVSTLIMLVTEKTREIGILKSMGMTDGTVLRIFVVQGLLIGVVGTTIGLVLGLLIIYVIDTFNLIPLPPDVYFIDQLPLRLEVGDTVIIILVSMTIALLATIYPALKASKLIPVDAIRHE